MLINIIYGEYLCFLQKYFTCKQIFVRPCTLFCTQPGPWQEPWGPCGCRPGGRGGSEAPAMSRRFRSIRSVETQNWAFSTHFGREWQSLCLIRNNGEYLGIAWTASTEHSLSNQDSPFRRPKRPDILDLMLWGHRSSQRRLSRREAERRRDDLKQGRNHGGLGWVRSGGRNHLIMPSWRSLVREGINDKQ